MNKKIPLGISIIYFNDNSKNIYAELPPDKEQAKRLSKRIYKRYDSPCKPPRTITARLTACRTVYSPTAVIPPRNIILVYSPCILPCSFLR